MLTRQVQSHSSKSGFLSCETERVGSLPSCHLDELECGDASQRGHSSLHHGEDGTDKTGHDERDGKYEDKQKKRNNEVSQEGQERYEWEYHEEERHFCVGVSRISVSVRWRRGGFWPREWNSLGRYTLYMDDSRMGVAGCLPLSVVAIRRAVNWTRLLCSAYDTDPLVPDKELAAS